MRNLVKVLTVGLLILAVSGCDYLSGKNLPGSHKQQSEEDRTVTLLDGQLTFTLPQGMTNQDKKVKKRKVVRVNRVNTYADKSGKKTIIVVISDSSPDGMDVLADRLEQRQRARSDDLQVVMNKQIDIDNHPVQRLDSAFTQDKEKLYSSVLLFKTNENLVTMQITLPADDQQQARAEADAIINTVQLQ